MKNMAQFLAYLQREGLKYQYTEGSELVHLSFGGKNGSYQVIVKVEDSSLQTFGLSSIRAPAGALPDLAMAIARANYGLKLGKFELDLNDGEIRYHMGVPFDGDLPCDRVLERMIHIHVAMLDRYMPAFFAVIYGNETPKAAVELVER